MSRPWWAVVVIVVLVISAVATLASFGWNEQSNGSSVIPISGLSQLDQHWVPNWGYRDELSPTNIDYPHFWSDNAGKIMTMAMIIHDNTDAIRADKFLAANTFDEFYHPEVLINSTSLAWMKNTSGSYVTNGIVELYGDNSSTAYEQLEIGNNYTGYLPLAYLGGDRIWANISVKCCALRAQSSEVFVLPDGFSKRSIFNVNGSEFYVIVNATLRGGLPYAIVSLQDEPLEPSGPSMSYAFLQLFNTTKTNPFETATYYATDGAFAGALKSRSGFPVTSGGVVMAYSNHTSVFSTYEKGIMSGQDAVAVTFGSQNIYDLEHWTSDSPFSHSWLGIGYTVPQLALGVKSAPIYARIYPIEHFDYRLANATARYIASAPKDVSVAPPVSFGFVSYGLSLLAANDSEYSSLAKGYWNYYYAAYVSSEMSTAYSRSTSLFALAGFELYGCNSTVESFTRDFVGFSPGSSIEEYGWATAALRHLYECSKSSDDLSLYERVSRGLIPGGSHFVALNVSDAITPAWTFQSGEAAAGLLIGGVPYNNQSVLLNMDAVYQSDFNGFVHNKPFGGDPANTEALPAYILSTWLFEEGMRNATGYWISDLSNCNVTSISYQGGTLTVNAVGRGGTLELSNSNGNQVFSINGNESVSISNHRCLWFLLVFVAVTVVIVLTYLVGIRKHDHDRLTHRSSGSSPRLSRPPSTNVRDRFAIKSRKHGTINILQLLLGSRYRCEFRRSESRRVFSTEGGS